MGRRAVGIYTVPVLDSLSTGAGAETKGSSVDLIWF